MTSRKVKITKEQKKVLLYNFEADLNNLFCAGCLVQKYETEGNKEESELWLKRKKDYQKDILRVIGYLIDIVIEEGAENDLHKLEQLKEIENELGIDLITLFKVIKQGYIFVEEQNTEEKEIVAEYVKPNFFKHTFDFTEPRKEIGKGRPFSRIGETRALDKKELDIRN